MLAKLTEPPSGTAQHRFLLGGMGVFSWTPIDDGTLQCCDPACDPACAAGSQGTVATSRLASTASSGQVQSHLRHNSHAGHVFCYSLCYYP